MGERLTWEQIAEKYPDQWVGLTDVEYEEDGANILAAVVADFTSSEGDLTLRMLDGQLEETRFTTPDTANFLPLGCAGMFG